MERDPLGEAERSGDVRRGPSLGLQVARHGQIVVLSDLERDQSDTSPPLGPNHLEVVGVHPVDGPLPVTS